MKSKIKYLLAVAAGFWGGLLTAQALIGAYARDGASFGAEPITLLALPLLIWCGYVFGHDARTAKEAGAAYERGWRDGSSQANEPRHVNCRCSIPSKIDVDLD